MPRFIYLIFALALWALPINADQARADEIFLTEGEVEILQLELDAMVALAKGKNKSAVSLMRKAVALEQKLPFKYGPPRLSKSTHELLGDVLAEAGEYELAVQAYEAELVNSLRRTNSLLGLARASAAHGDQPKSKNAYKQLTEIWHGADPSFDLAEEARSVTKGN